MIVLLGSSTAGGASVSRPELSYAKRLTSWLVQAAPGASMVNLAMGGYTTCQLRPSGYTSTAECPVVDTNRNVDAAMRKHPDLVMVHLPSNDASQGIDLSTSLKNLDQIVQKIRAGGAEPLLIGAHPRPMTGRNLDTLKAWARALESYPGVETVKLWDSLSMDSSHLKPELTSDGTHPNDSGHVIIYRQILRSTTFQNRFIASMGIHRRPSDPACVD